MIHQKILMHLTFCFFCTKMLVSSPAPVIVPLSVWMWVWNLVPRDCWPVHIPKPDAVCLLPQISRHPLQFSVTLNRIKASKILAWIQTRQGQRIRWALREWLALPNEYPPMLAGHAQTMPVWSDPKPPDEKDNTDLHASGSEAHGQPFSLAH